MKNIVNKIIHTVVDFLHFTVDVLLLPYCILFIYLLFTGRWYDALVISREEFLILGIIIVLSNIVFVFIKSSVLKISPFIVSGVILEEEDEDDLSK